MLNWIFKFFTSSKIKSIGWVNIYESADGRIITGSYPKKTKAESIKTRSNNPSSRYLQTTEIFIKENK